MLEIAQEEFNLFKNDIPNVLNRKILSKLSSIPYALSEDVNNKIQAIIDSIGKKLILTLESEVKVNFTCIDEQKTKKQELEKKIRETNGNLKPLVEKVKNEKAFIQHRKKREEENVSWKAWDYTFPAFLTLKQINESHFN